jgi:uncharacterized protein
MTARRKKRQADPLDDEGRARVNMDLLGAAYAGDLGGVDTALAQGAAIDAAHPETGLMALHIAVGTNNLPLVRYLIEERGAPFGPDGFGRWPTLVAIECHADDELSDYIVEQEARYLERNP